MKEKRKAILVSIIGTLGLILMIVGATYAWFSARIDGTVPATNVTTASLSLHFEGTNELSVNNILPGWSGTKTFTVKNTGTGEATYSIVLNDLINNFEGEGLEYKLSSTSTGTTEGASISEWISVPKSSEVEYLYEGISILPEETHSYTLEIRYKETGENQNIDQNKTLGALIFIEEIEKVKMNIGGMVTTEDGNVASNYEVKIESEPIVTYTDASGKYKLEGVESGTHTITITDEARNIRGTQELVIIRGEEDSFDGRVLKVSNGSIDNFNIKVTSNGIILGNELPNLTVEISGINGIVEPSTSTVEYNETLEVEITPNEGYKYSSNTCGGVVSGNTMTISNVTAAKTCTVTFEADSVTFTLKTSGNYDTTNSATTGTACYYVRNYYGGYNYTPSTKTFSYTYNGTTYNNCQISGTPTCKYTTSTSTSWTSGSSFNCASNLRWYSNRWINDYGGSNYGYYAGCSATVTCS